MCGLYVLMITVTVSCAMIYYGADFYGQLPRVITVTDITYCCFFVIIIITPSFSSSRLLLLADCIFVVDCELITVYVGADLLLFKQFHSSLSLPFLDFPSLSVPLPCREADLSNPSTRSVRER